MNDKNFLDGTDPSSVTHDGLSDNLLDEPIRSIRGDWLTKARDVEFRIGRAWRNTGMDPYEFAIFAHLVSRADDNKQSWPSAKTMAEECKMSRARVFVALKGLSDKGFIQHEQRKSGDGSLTSNMYTVLGGSPPAGLPSLPAGLPSLPAGLPSLPKRQEVRTSEVRTNEVKTLSEFSDHTVGVTDNIIFEKAKPKDQEEVIRYCSSIGLTESDAVYMWNKWQGTGFKIGTKAIRDWRCVIRSWKEQGYFPSQKQAQKVREFKTIDDLKRERRDATFERIKREQQQNGQR